MSDVRTQLVERLADLHRETAVGEERLHMLENEVLVLRQTLLRIDGASQVLREMLQQFEPPVDEVCLEPAGPHLGQG